MSIKIGKKNSISLIFSSIVSVPTLQLPNRERPKEISVKHKSLKCLHNILPTYPSTHQSNKNLIRFRKGIRISYVSLTLLMDSPLP